MSTEILTACLTRLQAFSYSPEVPVLYPGVNQEPPDTGPWIEASLFPNEPRDNSWDPSQCAEDRGFFQMLVGYRPGMVFAGLYGEVAASEVADALVAWFPKAYELGGVRVMKRGTRGPSYVEDGNKLFIPLTIHYSGVNQ